MGSALTKAVAAAFRRRRAKATASQRLVSPLSAWSANSREVRRLLEIHGLIGGTGPGHKHDVEVLNKSAIVLIVACWEAFVEDLAQAAFDALLLSAADHSLIPGKVKALASREIRADDDPRRVRDLASDGWRSVLSSHRNKTISKYFAEPGVPNATAMKFIPGEFRRGQIHTRVERPQAKVVGPEEFARHHALRH